jgi:multidrug efflux pump subunit AcrA (membrane-fusion protein)
MTKMNHTLFATLISLSALSGCFLFGKKETNDGSITGTKREKNIAVVKTIKVRKELSPRIIETTVSLEGRNQVDVYSRVAGRLSALSLKEGEAVKRSQILFKVDRTDPGENFMATPIESPVDGFIAKWNADEGAQITTQIPVVQVVDDRVLKATVSLPAKDWTLISSRTEVHVESNGSQRKSRISSISRAADPVSGRGSFEIEIDNAQRAWRAGMTGTAKLKVEPKPRILVPAQSVVLTDLGAFIYTVENSIAIRKPVKYEMMTNDVLEITEGLSGENEVVTSGNNMVTNNAPVRVVNGEHATENAVENKTDVQRKKP